MRVVRPGGRRPQRQARAAAHGLRGQAGKHTNDPRVFGSVIVLKIIKIIAFVVALLTVCPHQRDATSSTIADDLDIKRRELEDLDRNLQRLRSEQDRAAAAGESALRLRLTARARGDSSPSTQVTHPRLHFKSLQITSPSTHTSVASRDTSIFHHASRDSPRSPHHSRHRTRPHLRRSASPRYSPRRNPRCARFLERRRGRARARALPSATPFARCGSSPVGN